MKAEVFKADKRPEVVVRFQKELNETIVKTALERSSQPSQHFAPSSIVCPRNMYYRKTGKPTNLARKASSVRVTDSGTAAHKDLQEYMMKLNDTFEWVDVEQYVKDNNLDLKVISKAGNEVKLYSELYDISFLCDGIIYDKKNDKYYILEIKTEIMKKFWPREKEAPEHLAQGAAYSLLLDIKSVLYLYEGRDYGDNKVYIHTYTKKEIDKYILSKLRQVKKNLKDNTLPEPNKEFLKVCEYCPYRALCRDDEL